MAAAINFFAGSASINNIGGSGLGFYGSAGFGYSLPVSSYNGRTFITDSTGTAQGPEANNCQYLDANHAILGQTGSGISLLALPNSQSTLNVRFTNTTNVQVQNVALYGYDRVLVNNSPSGVNFYAASIVHPDPIQNVNGSGSSAWTILQGSGSYLNLVSGPGTSGLSPNGVATSDSRHDWYLALTVTPTTVGAKTFAGSLYLEYL